MKDFSETMVDPFTATGRLAGQNYALEPLGLGHADGLASAAADRRIWQYLNIDGADPRGFQDWLRSVRQDVESRKRVVYCLRETQSGRIAGSYGFKDFNLFERRVTVGSNWLTPAFWGSGANCEATLLLLDHLFATLHVNRCEFFIHVENLRMRRFLERIGMVEEGILRGRFRLRSGTICDLAIGSILSPEWRTVKDRLLGEIEKTSPTR